ncbi:DUF4258 domain-containing protein [Methanospirillum hungatei]|uniref:DUF4258 domain-containing protein n=1 Tax=Methanospirillum hungatei TaxID=2203 RepID=UPI0026EABFAB|nr:DUF4258 domain-containing protein [Methanospirillum hungatei]MCA1917592.1 DUF4258 domain-containing protein [Methanospirillum hungatei]
MASVVSGKKFITTIHAYQKMMERSILKEDVVKCIKDGTIIRTYNDSKPFPAYLVSHVCKNRTIHVTYAINEPEETIVIITAYEPDPALWDETYTYKVKK